MKKGYLFIIAGPSGVGKNSIIKEVLKNMPNFYQVPSYTTRQPRHDDCENQNRISIPRSEFENLIKKKQLADWAEIHGELYGKKKSDLIKFLREGKNLILDIDVQGLKPYKEQFNNFYTIFLKYQSSEDMYERLKNAHPNMTEKEIQRRIETAKEEMTYMNQYDQVITTYNGVKPEAAAKEIFEIIKQALTKN